MLALCNNNLSIIIIQKYSLFHFYKYDGGKTILNKTTSYKNRNKIETIKWENKNVKIHKIIKRHKQKKQKFDVYVFGEWYIQQQTENTFLFLLFKWKQ